MTEPLLSCERLCKSFPGREVLKDISLQLFPQEATGLSGLSGEGKSTLARILCRTVRPDSGRVSYRGEDLFTKKKRGDNATQIQIIPQHPYSALDPRQKIIDAIAEPLICHQRLTRCAAKKQALTLMQRVWLPETLSERYPSQVSGGEAQRAVIARALTISPKILIADESTAMLDTSSQALILGIYRQLIAEEGLSILLISHDIPLIEAFCSRHYRLSEGRLT